MSGLKYEISEQADTDLEDIWLHSVRKWSVEQADKYYNLLIQEFEFISENFMIGKSVDLPNKSYRMLQVKSHLIYYRMGENQKVKIIRVLHQRMNTKKRLNP